ncbi:MAG: hypothetical protein VCA40_10345 [Roseibacillus sp.]
MLLHSAKYYNVAGLCSISPAAYFGESNWIAGDAGLGLAIAKTCVEGLGGRIRASNWEGGGLVVKLEMDAELKCSEG